MKATEQYFPVVLFIMLYKVVLTFETVDKILWCNVTIQMKATEQYFPVILFTMLYKVVLTFESVDEIPWYDHSNESYWAVLSFGIIFYTVQGGSNLSCLRNPKEWTFKWIPSVALPRDNHGKKRNNQYSISSNKSFLGKCLLDSCSPFKTLSSQNLILLYTFYFFLTAFENTINNRVIFTIFLRNRGPLICRVNIYHHLKINSCFMFTYFLTSQNRWRTEMSFFLSFKWKLLGSTFLSYCLLCCTRWF